MAQNDDEPTTTPVIPPSPVESQVAIDPKTQLFARVVSGKAPVTQFVKNRAAHREAKRNWNIRRTSGV